MNWVDAVAIVIVAIAVILGWRSGFVIQAMALIGFVGGIALIFVLAPQITTLAADLDPWLRTLLILGVIAGTVFLAQGIGSAVGATLRRKLGPGVLGGIDNGLGAAFGMARGFFTIWLIGGLIAILPLNPMTTDARQSTILRTLDSSLPSPVVMAAELGRFMEEAGLPDVLVGAPPPIDTPVNGPSSDEAEQIVAAARASTVRVESLACGQFMTGSGFAVTPDHFVTNAHVVAGGEKVWISFDGRFDRYEATVVDFDPSLDIALLKVDDVDAAPLTLASRLPTRGEHAAGLGFTGGGRQRLIPGVISRTLSALGRDIYGGSIVPREIIEMRLDVSPGDSGGPVLMPDGSVGGVTFSESRENPQIGYALSPTAVAATIGDALRSSSPVATGVCISDR